MKEISMKKILVLALVAVFAVTGLFASFTDDYSGTMDEGSFALGVNLGTNTGVAVRYGYGRFDIFGDVGVDFITLGREGEFAIGADVGASWEVYDFDFGNGHHMPLTVGLMVPLGFGFGDDFIFNLSVLAQVGVQYKLPKYPWSFYARLGLGLGLDIAPDFDLFFSGAGSIGALYHF